MPKYYRFRATTPTRKTKRYREENTTDSNIERVTKNIGYWIDHQPSCSRVQCWYLRRNCWRYFLPVMFLRYLPTQFVKSIQKLWVRPVTTNIIKT